MNKIPEKKGFELRGTPNNPYHFSVGVVLIDKDKIATILKKGMEWTLPRETCYSNESLEDCLLRGLSEELGLSAEIERYLGSANKDFILADGTKVLKTTLYFQANLKEGKTTVSKEPDEQNDILIWLSPEEALEKFKEQSSSEVQILLRYLTNK